MPQNYYEEVLKGPYEFNENTKLASGISSVRSSVNPFTGKYRTGENYREQELYHDNVETRGFNSFASEKEAEVKNYPYLVSESRPLEVEKTVVRNEPKYILRNEPKQAETPDIIPKQMKVPELKEADNGLTLIIHKAKNMDLFKYDSENYKVFLSYDVNTCGVPIKSTSQSIQAGSSIDFNFSQEFQINSQVFKQNYRHSPLVINVNQGLYDSLNRCRETLVGICEVYIGLLFASVLASSDSDASVYGWYHIISTSGQPIGQLLIEIRTRIPIVQYRNDSFNLPKGLSQENEQELDKSLLKGIEDNLTKLNTKLTSKAREKEEQDKS